MENKMKNTVAFITGGASGIGAAIASRIIDHGGRVMIVDVNPAGQKVAETFGNRAKFVLTDVSSEKDVTLALNEAKKEFGGINVVINAAGIASVEEPYDFEKKKPHSLELYKRLMNVNALGTFNVATLATGFIVNNKPDVNNQRGLIINVSSILAFDSPGSLVAYGATKAAVAGMTLPLARSLGPKGIRVVTIAPGFTDTPMAAGIKAETARVFSGIEEINQSPKRHGTADEIAHLMQCVIENAYINAEVIRIDGGYRYVSPRSQ